jgi:hypothetical protein
MTASAEKAVRLIPGVGMWRGGEEKLKKPRLLVDLFFLWVISSLRSLWWIGQGTKAFSLWPFSRSARGVDTLTFAWWCDKV